MSSNHPFSFFLPPLNDELRLNPNNPGEWHRPADITFEQVAASLAVNTGNTVSVSSIPDMWARPLFFEIVLRNQNHPLHSQIKAQWKGMISAIALAEVQGLKLVAKLVDLGKLKSDFFVSSLLKLIPSKERCLYQIDGGRKNPWEHIYIFSLHIQGQYQTVGMTSPSTIVCPSEDGNWSDLPWWSEEKRILQSPISPEDHLHNDEKIQLWLWLQNLLEELTTQERYAVRIKEIIREFQTELSESLRSEGQSIDFNSQKLQTSSKNNYFNVGIEGGALAALNLPIAVKPMESSVVLMTPQSQREIIIIPSSAEEITKQWKKKAKDIWIDETFNLVSFNLEDFKRKNRDVEFLTADELFLEKFYFIKGANNLPGATLPKDSDYLTYNVQDNEYHLTPLLPINSKLLEYFTPEQLLTDIVEFQATNLNNNQPGVSVKLKLPLSGGEYLVTKNYPILEENAITEIPFIDVWPNFIAPGWQEYYVFYYDNRVDKIEKTFQINFPSTSATIHSPELKQFQTTYLEEFPTFIACKSPTTSEDLGLILLKTPSKVGNEDPNLTWIVGVDFGTSFTNVYYKLEQQPRLLTFSLDMLLQVTKPKIEADRSVALYEYFMPSKPQNLPVSTVLTTKGNQGQAKAIFDGRVYFTGDPNSFDPQDDSVYKTNLKWSTISNTNYNKLFLKHLALLITAEAAKKHVKKIEWTISYPSAFSRNDKGRYISAWKDIVEDLGAKTGIAHQWLPKEKGENCRPESLAIAHYFAEAEDRDLVYTTCIDMGGGTSDISIWLGNKLIHQCSILLAGNLLFSQFLKRKPGFIRDNFEVDISDLANEPREEPFYAKLNAILLRKGQKWLRAQREILDENADLRDIVQCSAIGIAGLYYYVGIILKALHLEGKYNRTQITPVYIGGNGSRILNWLAVSGRFDENCDAFHLFSKMLSIGSSFKDAEIAETLLSSQPKAEVACGLVLNQRQTRLTISNQGADYNELISGEDCEINGKLIVTTSGIHLEGEIKTFEVKELNNLKLFLDAFHEALKELRISSIAPLQEYNNAIRREQLWRYVKRGVEADLLTMTGQADSIRMEPPFILGLKSLLRVLARR